MGDVGWGWRHMSCMGTVGHTLGAGQGNARSNASRPACTIIPCPDRLTAALFLPTPRFADTISAVSMSADRKLLAAGCNNGRVMMWDVEQRELMWEHSHHAGRVESLAFNSLTEMASSGADGRISLVSVETGKQVRCVGAGF